MNDGLSLSVFVLEVDRKPVVAFASKMHADAEVIINDERVRHALSSVTRGGEPVCDEYSILRIRLARAEERNIYRERRLGRLPHASVLFAYLIELDRDEGVELDQALEELSELGDDNKTGGSEI